MKFNGCEFTANESESVLDLLLRHNQDINFSCKSGRCQSCLLQSQQGEISPVAQHGLKDTAIAQGFFLACQQRAVTIEQASPVDSHALFGSAQLIEKHLFSDNICRIRVEPSNPLYYHAGQFVNLKNINGCVRSYSLASFPKDESYLEFHIRRKPDGEFSNWLFDNFSVGDYIEYQGPIGECFYTATDQSIPLVLIGTGTGASPLYGIVKDAIHSEHTGSIHFYHGCRETKSLYLHDILTKLQQSAENFFYHPSVSAEQATQSIVHGRCNEIVLTELDLYQQATFFLCGNVDMVTGTKKKLYLRGISLTNIYADPFEYKDLRKSVRS